MQDTNKKWDAMVNICLNAAKKVLEEKSKSKNKRYKNETSKGNQAGNEENKQFKTAMMDIIFHHFLMLY